MNLGLLTLLTKRSNTALAYAIRLFLNSRDKVAHYPPSLQEAMVIWKQDLTDIAMALSFKPEEFHLLTPYMTTHAIERLGILWEYRKGEGTVALEDIAKDPLMTAIVLLMIESELDVAVHTETVGKMNEIKENLLRYWHQILSPQQELFTLEEITAENAHWETV